MANVNDPDGFTPAYHMSGGTIRPLSLHSKCYKCFDFFGRRSKSLKWFGYYKGTAQVHH